MTREGVVGLGLLLQTGLDVSERGLGGVLRRHCALVFKDQALVVNLEAFLARLVFSDGVRVPASGGFTPIMLLAHARVQLANLLLQGCHLQPSRCAFFPPDV